MKLKNKSENKHRTCESISSGPTCQETKNCSWNYGKCKTNSNSKHGSNDSDDQPPEPPKADPSGEERLPPEDPTGLDSTEETVAILLIKAKENALELGIVGTILFLVSCCCFCLLCRKDKSDRAKYERASTSIEMTDGSHFQDEPVEADVVGVVEEYEDDEESFGSSSNGKFRDNPSKKKTQEPEFEGDFA